MNSQCISIGFVGGIARPPTLPTTHTLFCMNSSLVFSKGGWGGRDCFLKGTRHVQSRSKVLNNQTQTLAFWEACWRANKQLNAILPATCLRGCLKGKAGRTHTRAQRYKITCSSDCSKGIHCVLVLFCYIQE